MANKSISASVARARGSRSFQPEWVGKRRQFDTVYEVVYSATPIADVPEFIIKPRGRRVGTTFDKFHQPTVAPACQDGADVDFDTPAGEALIPA